MNTISSFDTPFEVLNDVFSHSNRLPDAGITFPIYLPVEEFSCKGRTSPWEVLADGSKYTTEKLLFVNLVAEGNSPVETQAVPAHIKKGSITRRPNAINPKDFGAGNLSFYCFDVIVKGKRYGLYFSESEFKALKWN